MADSAAAQSTNARPLRLSETRLADNAKPLSRLAAYARVVRAANPQTRIIARLSDEQLAAFFTPQQQISLLR